MDDQTFIRSLIDDGARIESGGQLSGEEIGRILQRLTSLELQEGGPYATRGGRADLGDNMSIAYFLRTLDVRLPRLDAYISSAWKRKAVRSELERDLKKRIGRHDTKLERTDGGAMTDSEERVMRRITAQTKERFRTLRPELRKHAEAVMRRTVQGNPDKQMSLMALYMREALGSKGKKFSDEYVASLGLANVFFWSAFIVYDDFWDEDEAASPIAIPVANLFSRHYTDTFARLFPETTGFRRYFHETMDALDSANAWVISTCRMKVEGVFRHVPEKLPAYGNFGIKFYPAAGHVMGPVALLIALGFHALSSEVRTLQSYFEHYLVAMQLNDDAHDWKEDLQRGHISTVVYLLLKTWRAAHPNRNAIHVEKDMPELERMYWFEVIAPLCKAVYAHTKRSRAALNSLTSIENPVPLERFIMRNEGIAREALEEQKRSVGLIRSYSRRVLRKS